MVSGSFSIVTIISLKSTNMSTYIVLTFKSKALLSAYIALCYDC